MSGVMFERYFHEYWLQGQAPVSDGFGGTIWQWTDKQLVMGEFVTRDGSEIRIAEAQGLAQQGDFYVSRSVKLAQNDILRRVSNGLYFRITGLPNETTDLSVSQFQIYPAELTDPPK